MKRENLLKELLETGVSEDVWAVCFKKFVSGKEGRDIKPTLVNVSISSKFLEAYQDSKKRGIGFYKSLKMLQVNKVGAKGNVLKSTIAVKGKDKWYASMTLSFFDTEMEAISFYKNNQKDFVNDLRDQINKFSEDVELLEKEINKDFV